MSKLMKKVRYTQLMTPYESLFDLCSEYCGFRKAYEDLTLDICRSDKYKDAILAAIEKQKVIKRAKSIK